PESERHASPHSKQRSAGRAHRRRDQTRGDMATATVRLSAGRLLALAVVLCALTAGESAKARYISFDALRAGQPLVHGVGVPAPAPAPAPVSAGGVKAPAAVSSMAPTSTAAAAAARPMEGGAVVVLRHLLHA
uniref:Uncharacterized protein n=2 Tax=Triticinae TaxID=1648030 RepID=A0A453QHB6_AEGTS